MTRSLRHESVSRALALLALSAAAVACARLPAPVASDAPRATHGVAVGDVTHARAVLWSRTDRAARMRVEVREDGGDGEGGALVGVREVDLGPDSDFAGAVAVEGLRPATPYRARFWFGDAEGGAEAAAVARFRTAPAPSQPAALRLAFGGDLAGQNVCRDAREGFPTLPALAALRPDLFVGLGDMIYADEACEPTGRYGNAQVPGPGPATNLEGFRAHWRYAREDAGLRALLGASPYVAVWDDHETTNDAGPHHDTRDDPPYRSGLPLLPLARRALREWNPLPPGAPLHRRLRWGRHLDLFVLDTRSFRDPNFAPDTGAEPKTMLGAGQRRWLEERLPASDATWKVVVSSVPISVPTGSLERGRDGWADLDTDTGFERELLGILEAFRRAGVRNLLWLTTDVHFAAAFQYTPFAGDPGFRLYEFVVGPLAAALVPNPRFDRTLGPQRLFFYGPSGAAGSLEEAKRWLNFGVLEIAADGALAARVLNARGETVFRLDLEPR